MAVITAATEVLSLVIEIRDLCDSFARRIDTFRGNRAQLDVLKDEFSSSEQKVNLCHTRLRNYCQSITTQSFEFELIDLRGIKQTLLRVGESVSEIQEKLQKRAKRQGIKRFFRANAIADDINEQVEIVKGIGSQMNELNDKLQEAAQENDIFTPNFSAIPRIRGRVHLDYTTTDTMEGQLKETLLENIQRTSTTQQTFYTQSTGILGVEGMPGVGKTTALLGLAHDPDVQAAFSSGGIYFISVGKDASAEALIASLREIVRRSGGSRQCDEIDDSTSLASAIRTTSSWFATRKALFICDDMYQTTASPTGYFHDLSGLLDHSPASHMIVASRSSEIAAESSARFVLEPREETGNAARAMLLASADMTERMVRESSCEEHVRQVLELCKGLPLMISIAGAQLRRRRGSPRASFERILEYLNDSDISRASIQRWEQSPRPTQIF